MKVYTSKLGLRFAISPTHRPAEDGVVFFQQNEYTWILDQKLTPEEFSCLWHLKRDDFCYNPIPEKEETEASKLAQKYGNIIMNSLRGRQGEE